MKILMIGLLSLQHFFAVGGSGSLWQRLPMRGKHRSP